MTRKQTRMLRRILISVATLAVVWVLCAFVPLPWYAQLALNSSLSDHRLRRAAQSVPGRGAGRDL